MNDQRRDVDHGEVGAHGLEHHDPCDALGPEAPEVSRE